MKAKFEEKIDAEIKTYQDNILKIREWKENAEVFAEVVSKFEHLDPRPSCGVGVSCLEGVVCHLESVKNLSDVAPLLKAMKEAGFERVGDMSTYEEIRRVHWEFKREGKPAVLTAFFRDTDDDASPNRCRFVKVGTKTVDDFKLVCPDSEGGE